jgi:hypothetical protein
MPGPGRVSREQAAPPAGLAPFDQLYARLTARGKARNAALIACVRNLLIYANTVVQRGAPRREKPVQT